MVYDSPGHDVRLTCRARGSERRCAIACYGVEATFSSWNDGEIVRFHGDDIRDTLCAKRGITKA